MRSSLGCGGGDDVGVVHGGLYNLLFFWIEVLGQILVECGLLLLKF